MSLDDLISSGRGPGFIGMLMALVVLIGFGLLYLFAFDRELQGTAQSNEFIVAEQKTEIQTVKNWVANGKSRLTDGENLEAIAKEADELARENAIRKGTLEGLTLALEELTSQVESRTEEFSVYKDQYREVARNNAKGQKIAELMTVSGTIYRDVEIREVTAIGMQIRHSDGHKRIPFEELPEDLKDLFQYDPNQKEEAMSREMVVHQEYSDAVSAARSAAQTARETQREKQEQEAVQNLRNEIRLKREQAFQLSEEIKKVRAQIRDAQNQAASSSGRGRSYLDRSKAAEGRLNAMQDRLTRLRSQISALESQL